MTEGAAYVVYGDAAERIVKQSIATLDIPYTVCRERQFGFNNVQQSRLAKTRLLSWSPYDFTVYLDADTVVLDQSAIRSGFEMLRDGWDMCIGPSLNQDGNWLHHVDADERLETERILGHRFTQFQAGVFWVRRSLATEMFFEVWHEEWLRWQGQDQAAFLRAVHRWPIRLLLLSRPWFDGAIVKHRWGLVRMET